MKKTGKLIFLIFILILMYSCKRHYETCTWEKETTDMKVYSLDSLDSCKYSLACINIVFDTQFLPFEDCSTPSDSIVGKINNIFIICQNQYNSNFQNNDTINSIVNVIYQKDDHTDIETPVSLNDYLATEPICTFRIELFLTQPPDSTTIQSFKIIYNENDGTSYSAFTNSFYITP